MAQSILRQIVAGPRARHPEAGLDLCYVTDDIIATSGPSGTYPQRAYRNPLDQLVAFLDDRHGDNWAIWEFRAEGTGYADEDVHNRVWHFPWPDHHPPPFALVPRIMASMRDWHAGAPDRVIVGHCKAGKGRTGSMTVSYLMAEKGWSKDDALARFTERRMRPGMGAGVSIPSQLRWLDYVERWAAHGKRYVEAAVQVSEVHIMGLRDGVKIAFEGFVEEGRIIKTVHVFRRDERDDNDSGSEQSQTSPVDRTKEYGADDHERPTNTLANVVAEVLGKAGRKAMRSRSRSKERTPTGAPDSADSLKQNAPGPVPAPTTLGEKSPSANSETEAKRNTIYRPSTPVIVPTSDVNLSIERRSRAGYGWTLVTSVAHVWFNVFFEGKGPEKGLEGAEQSGVFSIDWEAMDGIKGSARKGPRAFDRVSIVWSIVKDPGALSKGQALPSDEVSSPIQVSVPRIIEEPAPGEPVTGTMPAGEDDRRAITETRRLSSDLGLRLEQTNSAGVSKATSIKSEVGAIDREYLAAEQSPVGANDSASEDGADGIDRRQRLHNDRKEATGQQALDKGQDEQGDTVEVNSLSQSDVANRKDK